MVSPAPPSPNTAPHPHTGKVISYLAIGLFFATFGLAQLVPIYPHAKALAALSALVAALFRAVSYYLDGKTPTPGDLSNVN